MALRLVIHDEFKQNTLDNIHGKQLHIHAESFNKLCSKEKVYALKVKSCICDQVNLSFKNVWSCW